MRIHRTAYFLQDGAPCHKSKGVMSLLKQCQEEFSIIDWPGNSPDLNPIKNCWSHMKRKLKGDRNITSLPRLVEAIMMIWVQDMSLDYFQNLANSILRRQKEEMTKY
jgi:hypothetical protein